MSKETDLIKCIISEIDDNLYSDFGGNPCISYTSNLKKLLLALDTPEVRYFFENYEQQQQRISELEEQLKNAIMPKFKFMEKVWHINKDYFYKKDWYIEELLINGFEYKIDKRKNALVMWYSTYFNDYKNYKYQEKDLFATKEDALKKLEELGEKK